MEDNESVLIPQGFLLDLINLGGGGGKKKRRFLGKNFWGESFPPPLAMGGGGGFFFQKKSRGGGSFLQKNREGVFVSYQNFPHFFFWGDSGFVQVIGQKTSFSLNFLAKMSDFQRK